MFPDIPEASIRYDLSLSGNAEVTCEKILQQGYLPLPPPDFPGADEARQAVSEEYQRRQTPSTSAAATATAAKAASSSSSNLISRFHLESRLQEPHTTPKGKEPAAVAWSPNAQDRQQSLQERKAQMILQARKRLEERCSE